MGAIFHCDRLSHSGRPAAHRAANSFRIVPTLVFECACHLSITRNGKGVGARIKSSRHRFRSQLGLQDGIPLVLHPLLLLYAVVAIDCFLEKTLVVFDLL